MENGDKLEEGLWTSRPKQRYVDRHCLTVSLSLYPDWVFMLTFKDSDLSVWRLPGGYVSLVGDRKQRAPIL